MRGMGGVFKRGPVWWIRYGHRGRKYRESSKSADRAVALALLKQRVGELSQGRISGPAEERVTFEELAADYLEERAVRGAAGKALKWSKARVDNLGTVFRGMRAVDITPVRIREFAAARLDEGKAPGTVNRDLGVPRPAPEAVPRPTANCCPQHGPCRHTGARCHAGQRAQNAEHL